MKKEKRDQKRLNKERKLELRRLELEKAKELKKPKEDMCLLDQKVFTTHTLSSSVCGMDCLTQTISMFTSEGLIVSQTSSV